MALTRYATALLSASIAAVSLAGCQGGAVVGSPVANPSSAPSATPTGATPRPTSLATAPPTAPPTPLPPGVTPSPTPVPTPTGLKLYVVNHSTFGAGNAGTPSVTVYPITASGDATPIAVLSGAATMENQIYFPAVDSYSQLYLGNQNGSTTSGTVTEFPGPLNGNIAPTQTLTGFYQPVGIGVDRMNALYVGEAGAIDVYASGATAGTAPIRRISGSNTELPGQSVYEIFVERTGKQDVALQNAVVTFPYGATGNVAPTQYLYGATTGIIYALGVAADSNGNIYVTNFTQNNVLEFSSTATGNAAPSGIVVSTSFNEPWGIFFDSNDTAYVANRGNNSILVFASGSLATGIPTATIGGADTHLDDPTGVFVR
jgi:hypothetical protein